MNLVGTYVRNPHNFACEEIKNIYRHKLPLLLHPIGSGVFIVYVRVELDSQI